MSDDRQRGRRPRQSRRNRWFDLPFRGIVRVGGEWLDRRLDDDRIVTRALPHGHSVCRSCFGWRYLHSSLPCADPPQRSEDSTSHLSSDSPSEWFEHDCFDPGTRIVETFELTLRDDLKLYWCETEDHDEDWFVAAHDAHEARHFFSDNDGYPYTDVRARRVALVPEHWQCHGTGYPYWEIPFLEDCGGKRVVESDDDSWKFNGRIYTAGNIVDNTMARLRMENIDEGSLS
jgi:hypothetical protein